MKIRGFDESTHDGLPKRKKPVSFRPYAYTDVNPVLRGGSLGDQIARTAPRIRRKKTN